jgi:hypothetical protein
MAILVMILGESGTGKSASLRNFKKEDLAVVNVIGKPLPFRSKGFESINSDDYGEIRNFLKKTTKQSIVIDDAQYLMANEYMRRAKETGYQKFTDIGQNFWSLMNYCRQLPDDVIVYFLQHTETSADGSTTKAKTIGKMLDEKISLEGMCTIVLRTSVEDGVYSFTTHNSGQDTVKSPVGMFEPDLIPNDLKIVDGHIREYYGMETTTETIPEPPQAPQAEDQIMAPDGKYFDINASDNGIVDDENPLDSLTEYGRIKRVMNQKGITDEELKALVEEKGIYSKETRISDYDPDFITYLIDNIDKVYKAIVVKRDPLGDMEV